MANAGDPKWLLSLKTALGADALLPIGFRADESLSKPFVVTITVASKQRLIDPDQILYKPATLTVRPNMGTPRLFNGMIRSITANGMPQRGWWRYDLVMVPKLWFMGQTVDCRVFQQKSIGDILTTICGEAGQTISMNVGEAATQEYVTQYNETDLQFAARLIEQAGYFYFFQHSDSDHTLTVIDKNTGFPAGAGPTLAVVHEGGGADTLSTWQQTRQTAWGNVRLLDYDPQNPGTPVDGTTATKLKAAGTGARDVTQWPALTLKGDDATARTGFIIEAAEVEASLIATSGRNHTLGAGSRFKLYRDPFSQAQNVDYIVRQASHSGSDETYIGGTSPAEYSNELVVFPAALPWRQPLVTPRPVMAGISAAIVLGDAGEEIHADALGRIKVRLLWDHRKDTVSGQATWVRVIQPWAGNTWGWQHLPRVGSEVAVAFMDGDPDRPVVAGGLYNGSMSPVFAVPGEQSKSGWRTRSTKGGGTADFSEFSVDDTAGSEVMFLHAQKDMTTEVENNQSLTVDKNRTVAVKQDETVKVDQNQSVTVGNKQTVKVTSGRETTIQSGGDQLTVQTGDLTVSVSSGKISMEAMTGIELTVGGNSIKIDQSGVTINGIIIKANGQAMLQVKSPMTQVNGDGMLMMKGGIVMVN